MPKEKFYDQARVTFQKLTVRKGDLVTVSFPEDMTPLQVQSTVDYLGQLATEFGCAVVALGNGIQLDKLPEEQMNELGWFKAEDFNREKLN